MVELWATSKVEQKVEMKVSRKALRLADAKGPIQVDVMVSETGYRTVVMMVWVKVVRTAY